uniref:Uncharacterized protein n=1 Tax=Rhizophora mucronata TaxID=61149 RepID=A0A2P2N725_RHIMU
MDAKALSMYSFSFRLPQLVLSSSYVFVQK